GAAAPARGLHAGRQRTIRARGGVHVREHLRQPLHPRPPSGPRARVPDLGMLGPWLQVLERDRRDRRRPAARGALPIRSRAVSRRSERHAMRELDHLIFVAPSLATGVDLLEQRLGVRATVGGKHIGRGTENAVLGLGERRYLEVLAPDPDQPEVARRFLGVSERTSPRLATWVARASDLAGIGEAARDLGGELGETRGGARPRPLGL